MRRRWILCLGVLALGCGAESGVDPADLALRDLLGLDPQVAEAWGAEERAAAREVLERSLGEGRLDERSLDERDPLAAAAALDAELAARDEPPWAALSIVADGERALVRREAPLGLAELAASAAGRARLTPRAPFAAAFLEDGVVLVNPVVLAALGPEGAVALAARASGNPYNFYGSLGECAAAERARCEACLPTATCARETRDAADGNSECQTLAASGGRGYYQLCANLSLAIRTVGGCVEDRSDCGYDASAGNQLSRLSANDRFVDDDTCRGALDACLSRIYGGGGGDFPAPPRDAGLAPDAAPTPPPPPPRELEIDCSDCGESCDCDPQGCDTTCEDDCDDCEGCDSDCDGDCDGDDCLTCAKACGSSGGGGSANCNVARRAPGQRRGVALAWALLPLLVIEALRRREARRRP
jgi:hypothetical protein